MHPGHIKHFQAAKNMGDLLVVTVTPDVYVDKGPGRPVYNQDLRASSVAALECVDFVAIKTFPFLAQKIAAVRPAMPEPTMRKLGFRKKRS